MKRRAFLAALAAAPFASRAASVAEIAGYAGADRQQRLVDGARAEGGEIGRAHV